MKRVAESAVLGNGGAAVRFAAEKVRCVMDGAELMSGSEGIVGEARPNRRIEEPGTPLGDELLESVAEAYSWLDEASRVSSSSGVTGQE